MASQSAVLSALASPRRREILRLVWERELSAGEIHQAMPDVTFGAVSLQLRTLTEAGLLEARAEGRGRYYCARQDAIAPFAQMLESMWDNALWKLQLEAELEETRRGPRPQKKAKRA